MTSVDVIPRMLNVKVALRNFGLIAFLYRRRADCVLTPSVFCWPRYPHPYWAPCYCFCNREMGQILAPWWLTIFKIKQFNKILVNNYIGNMTGTSLKCISFSNKIDNWQHDKKVTLVIDTQKYQSSNENYTLKILEKSSDLQMVWQYWRTRHSLLPSDQAGRFLWWCLEIFLLKDWGTTNRNPPAKFRIIKMFYKERVEETYRKSKTW